MVRWLLIAVAVAAFTAGTAQVFAKNGPRGADVAGVQQQAGGGNGNAPAHSNAGGNGSQDGTDTGTDTDASADTDTDTGTDTATGTDTGGVAGTEALALQAGGNSACTEDAETMTHGCAVSTAVHAAQATATPGPGRGIAVSMAARNADCSMLPEGAQAACAKRAEKPHPNADGTPGNKPVVEVGAATTTTATTETLDTTQGNPGRGNGRGKK